jgi:hypothetical protein
MVVLIAFWFISLGSIAILIAALQQHDWLGSTWAFVTFSIFAAMTALRKKNEKRLKFAAVALIPYALVSLVAALAAFFGSAGWAGYGTFGFYLVPVVVIVTSHALSVFGYTNEPIQPLQTTTGSSAPNRV